MKQLSMMLFVLFLSLSIYAQSPIDGVWNTGTDNTKIKMKRSSDKYIGTISSSNNAKAKKGTIIVKDVKSKNGVWKGKLYAAKKKKWLDAKFVRKGNTLQVTISSGWMSKTLEWKKVK